MRRILRLYMCVCVCVCVRAAKYGTPNYRLETIFGSVPDARRLGLLHYMMTTTQTMTAEEVESRLKSSSSSSRL